MTSSPVYGPCAGWDDPIYCASWPTGSEGVTGSMLLSAAETLDMASAQQFGLCERTVRPCRRDCFDARGTWYEWTGANGPLWPRPLLYNGQWFNLACGSCYGSCSCVGLEEAILPGPVYAVTQVKLNGSIMASGSYRLDEDRILVRTDGGRWPFCQDLSLEDTEDNTWSATVQFGRVVPTLGKQALGELAIEYAKACVGVDCRLPANVANLVRQGVTLQFSADEPYFERLYFVRNFLDTYNPDRRRGRAQAFDVEGPSFRRNRTTAY